MYNHEHAYTLYVSIYMYMYVTVIVYVQVHVHVYVNVYTLLPSLLLQWTGTPSPLSLHRLDSSAGLDTLYKN